MLSTGSIQVIAVMETVDLRGVQTYRTGIVITPILNQSAVNLATTYVELISRTVSVCVFYSR